MGKRMSLIICAALVVAISACATAAEKRIETPASDQHAPARAEGTTLRVASFNILYQGNKKFPWDTRREAVADCLRDMAPDVFGLQEAEWEQVEHLMDVFPQYACVGRGRDDGHLASEFTPIFFRANRFALKEANVFWLSDTPDVAGSNQWGGACIRVAAVVVLIDRTDGTSVGICNTHMDHISAVAREKGARLIRQRLPSYGSNLKWVVMGDFNARPGSVPYQALVGAEPGKITLIDTYAALHPKAGPEAGSFHGYTGKIGEGRIDWILASPEFTALAAAINQSKYRGMYPSDHFAAWADLKCTRAHLRQD